MPRSKGRAGRPFRRLSAALKAEVANGAPCCLCGLPIDLTLHWNDRMSFTVQHHDPLSLGGAPRDRNNAGPAHRSCNSMLGNRLAEQTLSTSRAW